VTKQSATFTRLVMVLVLLFVFAGCAAKPSLTPGTYASTITREDVTSYTFIGEWELTLTEGNGLSLSLDGRFREDGNYTLTQDQIVFTQMRGKYPCGATGTYQWAFDGKRLTLTTVEDTCEGRPTIFTMHPWTKQD